MQPGCASRADSPRHRHHGGENQSRRNGPRYCPIFRMEGILHIHLRHVKGRWPAATRGSRGGMQGSTPIPRRRSSAGHIHEREPRKSCRRPPLEAGTTDPAKPASGHAVWPKQEAASRAHASRRCVAITFTSTRHEALSSRSSLREAICTRPTSAASSCGQHSGNAVPFTRGRIRTGRTIEEICEGSRNPVPGWRFLQTSRPSALPRLLTR